MDLVEQPDNPRIAQLMEICYESHLAVHRALVKAGAHFTSLGDSLAGPDVISPRMFHRFAHPYEDRLVKDLAADGIFVVIHICGDTSRILDILAEYESCGFELDYKTDAVKAKHTAGSATCCWETSTPAACWRGDGGAVREATRQLISPWKPGGRFILNAGCAIPPSTPPENVGAAIHTARDCGEY